MMSELHTTHGVVPHGCYTIMPVLLGATRPYQYCAVERRLARSWLTRPILSLFCSLLHLGVWKGLTTARHTRRTNAAVVHERRYAPFGRRHHTSVKRGSFFKTAAFLSPSLCRSFASSFLISSGASTGSELGPSGCGSGAMPSSARGWRSE